MPSIPTFESLARIGFAARGVMYLVIGFLALWAGRTEDGAGALEQLNGGLGRVLLAVMALGFFGYGVWRLSEAAIDTEGHGDKPAGLAVRLGGAVSGLVHLGLLVLAANMVLGGHDDGGDSARQGAAATLDLPGGEIVLLLAGAGLLVTGAVQMVKAVKASFLRHLDGRAGRWWIKALGRAGFAARGIVFLLVGWFVLHASLESDAGEAGGIGAALEAMSTSIRVVVAAGLILFGLFSFVEARHRRINDPRVLERLSRHGARMKARI
jgi:hypothetical protein